MDMRYEAAPMAADVELIEAVIRIVTIILNKALSLVRRVASFSCPTLGSHSLSAVAPDTNFIGGTA